MRNLLKISIDELDKILIKEYKVAAMDIYVEMVDTYNQILGEDGQPLLSHLYKFNRYYKLFRKINAKLNDLGVSQDKDIGLGLQKLYRDNEAILNKELHLNTNINYEQIAKAISEDWVGDGMNYSDRIWKDKANMQIKLRSILTQSIIQGKSPEMFADELKAYLNVKGIYPILRLLRTEMARMQTRSTLDKYKEAGIAFVKVIEPMDDRTCDICIDKNETVVAIEDAVIGDNIPPFHPQCRGIITAII